MFSVILNLSIHAARLIDRYAPTNILLRRIIARHPTQWPARALRWGITFLATAYLLAVLVQYGLHDIACVPFMLLVVEGTRFVSYALRGYAARRCARRAVKRAFAHTSHE